MSCFVCVCVNKQAVEYILIQTYENEAYENKIEIH
jgi:hypothetical protein